MAVNLSVHLPRIHTLGKGPAPRKADALSGPRADALGDGSTMAGIKVQQRTGPTWAVEPADLDIREH
jgi:hypothetical protein